MVCGSVNDDSNASLKRSRLPCFDNLQMVYCVNQGGQITASEQYFQRRSGQLHAHRSIYFESVLM